MLLVYACNASITAVIFGLASQLLFFVLFVVIIWVTLYISREIVYIVANAHVIVYIVANTHIIVYIVASMHVIL